LLSELKPLGLLSSSSFHLSRQVQVVEVLLERGADLHVQDEEGRTPSQLSSGQGFHELAQLLSEHPNGWT
jgi:ankyrin repeat protein